MRRLFYKNFTVLSAAIFGCLLAFSLSPAYSEDMTDFDYDFIDNAFSNPNPTTNKQFEEVMQRFEKEPNGLFYKMKRFFNRNNPEYDKNLKKMYENPNNQPARIKDVPQNKPTVTIGADFYDSSGNVQQAGHYQVDYKENDGKYTISLLQGQTRVAEIKAIPYEDDWETPAVVYSRAVMVQDDLIRIIYANIDLTIQGYVRLKTPMPQGF